MKKKKKPIGHIILFIILVIFLSILLFGNKTWWHLLAMYKDVNVLEGEIKQVRGENDNLQREIHKLKTNYAYVEKTAREELGLVLPGEIEYRFIPVKTKKDTK